MVTEKILRENLPQDEMTNNENKIREMKRMFDKNSIRVVTEIFTLRKEVNSDIKYKTIQNKDGLRKMMNTETFPFG
jgi:hypothetical protein